MSETENKVITWEEAAKAKAAEQALQRAASRDGNKFISFKSGMLSIDKVPVPGNKLTVIALCFLSENSWYSSKYDPIKQQTPACWSVYDSAETMIPSVLSEEPQADTCKACVKFQWGTDPNGGRGKACKTRLRVALLSGSVQSIEDVKAAELRFATLPVMSVNDFDVFIATCQLQYQRPMFGVFSELAVIPDAKSQYLVKFKPLAPVNHDLMLAILERVNSAEVAIKYDYQSREMAPQPTTVKALK